MIELHQFTPAFGLMNASPFCMKVEVFLKLAGLEYRCVNGAMPMGKPKGKLPVLHDDAQVIADSQAIVEHLQRRYADRLPPALRAPMTGAHHALRRMLEESTYFCALWLRWIDDTGWVNTAPAFFGQLPWPAYPLVPALVRRKMRRDLIGQGTGRHSRDEICQRALADLSALEAMLGEQPFFAGVEPGAIDATTYAFIANLLWAPIDNPVRAEGLKRPALVAYAERMQARVGR